MTFGPTFDRVLSLEAKTLVELRCLKAVRCENYLQATASKGLLFGDLQKSFAQALTATLLVNPYVGDMATAPRVATEAGDDFARVSAMLPAKSFPSKYPVASELNRRCDRRGTTRAPGIRLR